MLKLKNYQEDALGALLDFVKRTRSAPVNEAWQEAMTAQKRTGVPYQDLFPGIPCVCLRVPTGGGKTLMAAHAVAPVGQALKDSDFPVVLWLTPSDTIRTQTLEAGSR